MSFINKPVLSFTLVFAGVLVAFLWTWPQYNEIQTMTAEAEILEEQIASQEEYMDDLRSMEARLQEHQDELDKVYSAIPSNHALPIIYENIQNMSAESGLGLIELDEVREEDVSISEEGTSPRVVEGSSRSQPSLPEVTRDRVTVIATMAGDYEGLKGFLDRANGASRLYEPEEVSFIRGDGIDQFVFSVHFRAYSY